MVERNREVRSLRARARGLLRAHPPQPIALAPGAFDDNLAEELRIHQVELELQNEALREANFELERSRRKYRDLYEFAPVACVQLDPRATVLDANAAALRLFGMDASRLLGTRLSMLLAPESVTCFALHRRDVLANGAHSSCEITLHLEGRSIEVRLESIRIDATTGSWLAALSDVSVQTRLTRTLEENVFVSTVLEAAGLLVILDARGRVFRINRSCQQLLGSERSALGHDFAAVFAAPSEREQIQEQVLEAARHGTPSAWESRWAGDHGRVHHVAWSCTPLRRHGSSIEHLIVSGIDLTERERLQRELLVNDRLAAVGRLAAGVGHEVNNPLAYVQTSLELAARLLAEPAQLPKHAARLSELIGAAHEGTDRIRVTVDDLRAYSRCDSASTELLDVRQVLDTCAKLTGNEIRHRARLCRSYAEVPLVAVNRGRLAQVFLHLLMNAAQSLVEGRADDNEIRLRTLVGADGQVVVEVEDTSSLVDPRDLPHVFDPFYTSRPDERCSGLGLSVCHAIVSSLGGSIRVEPVPGRGRLFRVALPPAAAPARSVEPPVVAPVQLTPRASSAATKLDILVVDDEPRIARSMAELLAEHHVRAVTTGSDALAACKQRAFDLIFCDVLMPQMSGVDVYEALRAAGKGQEQRIVFMTGGAFTPHACDFLARVPNTVLTKPIALNDLLTTVASRAAEQPCHAP